MFGLGMPELIIIMLIVLVLFGVGKLPQIGEGLGKAIRGFRRATSEPELPENRSSKEEPPKPQEKERP